MSDFNSETEETAKADTFNDEAGPAEVGPEEFDLAQWLEGVGPARRHYSLDGKRIPMRSRTQEWAKEFRESAQELDRPEADRIFLAAHIEDDRLTSDTLMALQEHRAADFYAMVELCLQLDTQPTGKTDPRFLRGASD